MSLKDFLRILSEFKEQDLDITCCKTFSKLPLTDSRVSFGGHSLEGCGTAHETVPRTVSMVLNIILLAEQAAKQAEITRDRSPYSQPTFT